VNKGKVTTEYMKTCSIIYIEVSRIKK